MKPELETTLSIEELLASENLAEEFEERELNKISEFVCEGYESDMKSRESWEGNLDSWMEMALQVAEEKSYPWDGASNVKYPLLSTAALQFSSRAYPALVPGTNVVRGRVVGKDYDGSKAEKAYRIGKHMSYQILEEMSDWEEEMDRLCVSLPILGTMFKKTYFSPAAQRNVSEIVYPKELVVNYYAKSLEDAPRKTHVIEMQDNDIYERVASNLYLDYGDELYKAYEVEQEDSIDDTRPPAQHDSTTPHCILEQHTFLDLDGDGYEEPYIITVHKGCKKVLRIVARFDADGINIDGEDKIIRIEPIEYFTKFSFVPNPDGGFYDIGFGLLLGPINETVNTLINQLVDSGSLSNLQAGFIAKGLRIKGGNKNFHPGEWKYVNTIGDDLRKNIMPLPVREPSNVLFTLLGMMIESGQKLASVTDMLLGENPGQNQPASTTMAVIEQGLKVFTSIYKRLHRSLKKEYKKLFVLNSKYLSEEEWFTILDAQEEQGVQIRREYYDIYSADVIPASDPNVASESVKLMKATGLLQLLQLGTVNPAEVTKRVLEAQDQPGIEALMTMPPPQPSEEQLKLQWEQRKFAEEQRLEWAKLMVEAQSQDRKLDIDELKAQADSFSKVAQIDINEDKNELDREFRKKNTSSNMEEEETEEMS